MLIALIADTHLPRRGANALPARCRERIRAADLVVHAGDVSTIDALRAIEQIGPPVRAVQGNVDCPELRTKLPETLVVEQDGTSIAVVHDAGPARGRLARMRRRFPDADAVVFGHSHLPLHEMADGFQIFNPGSPTERRRAPRHTMGIATVAAGAARFEHLAVD